ncbi:MAG: lipid II:glycine glycyltransferase FemX [Syntrophobacteraceae bacterium]
MAWVSREFEDACWDRFLQGSPLGQYQQSTIWARAKKRAGWRPVRVVLTIDNEIVGGFQILQHLWLWGGIGYVSKGPVVPSRHAEIADYVTELLWKVSRSERLWVLVVQPPDGCEQMEKRIAQGGFASGSSVEVNDATWIFDLRGGLEALELQMAKQTRRKVRQAEGRGVNIREGGRQELHLFFDLMLSTCRRQRVDPNPPQVHHLLALWDAARPLGCVRLTFAEHNGKPLSGLLCISFGKTLTLWKRGWNGMERGLHPNELITFEALKRAVREGYEFCDYSSFDKEMAAAMKNGEPFSPEQIRSRHCFITRFGGMPRILPQGHLLFANPFVRSAAMVLRRVSRMRRTGRGRLLQPMAGEKTC